MVVTPKRLPTEIIRPMARAIKNTIKPAKLGSQRRLKNTPTLMPMPFPPLNFRKIEKTFPSKASKPLKTKIISFPGTKYRARVTAKAPLAMSKTSVSIPHLAPAIRQTLVIPILPLPWVRTSTPFTHFTSKYPKGIDPSK